MLPVRHQPLGAGHLSVSLRKVIFRFAANPPPAVYYFLTCIKYMATG